MKKADLQTLEGFLDQLHVILQEVSDFLSEEQDTFDTMSERVAEGPKGEEIQEIITSLESAHDGLETPIDNLIQLVPQKYQ